MQDSEEKTEITFLNNIGSGEPSRKLSTTMRSANSPGKNNEVPPLFQQFHMMDMNRKIRRNKKDNNARINSKFANNRSSLPAKM